MSRTGLPVAMLVVLALAAAACGSSGSEDSALRSGVRVEALGCSLSPAGGSGAVVGERGIVVTSAHVVAGSTQVTVTDADGQRHAAIVVAFDPASDLAILRVDDLQAPPLPPGRVTTPAKGQLLSWDDGSGLREVVIAKRIRVTIEDIYIDELVTRDALEIQGDITIGDSGGVLIVDGAAVGLIYAKSRNREEIGFALDDLELATILNAARSETRVPGQCPP